MRTLLAALALAASVALAHAQSVTFPAPTATGDAVVCLYINSAALGAPAYSCYDLPPATTTAMLAAYGQQCPATFTPPAPFVPGQAPAPPAPPAPCTVTQVLAYMANSLQQQVLGTAQAYLQQQAARAVTAPTVKPIQ
jgi:hypothetical protein